MSAFNTDSGLLHKNLASIARRVGPPCMVFAITFAVAGCGGHLSSTQPLTPTSKEPTGPASPTSESGPTETQRQRATDNPAASLAASPGPRPVPLPPGDYLLYSARSNSLDEYGYRMTELSAITLDAQRVWSVLLPSGDEWCLSPDGRRLAYTLLGPTTMTIPEGTIELFNLETGETVAVAGSHSGLGSWSPDASMLAIHRGGEVSIVAVATGQRTQVTDCAQWGAGCGFPMWSPDGHWIAFYVETGMSGAPDARNGLYLMDTACLSSPSTCWERIRGLWKLGPHFTWSPDSRLLASPASTLAPGSGILVFDVSTMRQVNAIPFQLAQSSSAPVAISWSPDGSHLAIASGTVLDVATGDIVMRFEGSPDGHVQWLHAPPPSQLAAPHP